MWAYDGVLAFPPLLFSHFTAANQSRGSEKQREVLTTVDQDKLRDLRWYRVVSPEVQSNLEK